LGKGAMGLLGCARTTIADPCSGVGQEPIEAFWVFGTPGSEFSLRVMSFCQSSKRPVSCQLTSLPAVGYLGTLVSCSIPSRLCHPAPRQQGSSSVQTLSLRAHARVPDRGPAPCTCNHGRVASRNISLGTFCNSRCSGAVTVQAFHVQQASAVTLKPAFTISFTLIF
jgi:hypothetical protein